MLPIENKRPLPPSWEVVCEMVERVGLFVSAIEIEDGDSLMHIWLYRLENHRPSETFEVRAGWDIRAQGDILLFSPFVGVQEEVREDFPEYDDFRPLLLAALGAHRVWNDQDL